MSKDKAVIVGTGLTHFGKNPGMHLSELTQPAVLDALQDAGITAADVQAVYFGNAIGGLILGQEMIRGQTALTGMGLGTIPFFNVENACASGSSAFNLACSSVLSGQTEIALAVGAERMAHEDPKKPLIALQSAADVSRLPEYERDLYGNEEPEPGETRSFFMDIYSKMAKDYMRSTGATATDFANVAVKNRAHGASNDRAQFQKKVDVNDVLSSRMISDPLTLMMCSPIGDGAAALVVTSENYAKRHGLEYVEVMSTVELAGFDDVTEDPSARAAALAYDHSGLGPGDINVVELHDAAAPAELTLYEDLGFAGPGDGLKLLASGDTWLGGRMPVNPSGGLLSRGHPVGATGTAQLVELADQLRGRSGRRQVEGARVALAENHGGYMSPGPAAATVTILRQG